MALLGPDLMELRKPSWAEDVGKQPRVGCAGMCGLEGLTSAVWVGEGLYLKYGKAGGGEGPDRTPGV